MHDNPRAIEALKERADELQHDLNDRDDRIVSLVGEISNLEQRLKREHIEVLEKLILKFIDKIVESRDGKFTA